MLTLDELAGGVPAGGNPWLLGNGFRPPISNEQVEALLCAGAFDSTDDIHTRFGEEVTTEIIQKHGFVAEGFYRQVTFWSAVRDDPSISPKCAELWLGNDSSVWDGMLNPATVELHNQLSEQFWASNTVQAPLRKLEACLVADYPHVARALHDLTSTTPGLASVRNLGPGSTLMSGVPTMGMMVTLLPDQSLNPEEDWPALRDVLQGWVPEGLVLKRPSTAQEGAELAYLVDVMIASAFWDCYQPLHTEFVEAERLWTYEFVSEEDWERLQTGLG